MKFEDVLSEVHTAYAGVIAGLTNELAEAKAANKALAAELEGAQQALRVQENRKPGLPQHLSAAGRSSGVPIPQDPE